MSMLSLTLTYIGGAVVGYVVGVAWPRFTCKLGVHGPFVYELRAQIFTGEQLHRITCKRCGKELTGWTRRDRTA